MTTIAPSLASAGWVSSIGSVAGARLASIGTVLQVVSAGVAAGVSALAHEDAGVHVGSATARGFDVHGIATHVDLSRDINRRVCASGELAPCVVNLTPLREGSQMVVERSEATGDTIGERNGDFVATLGKRVGDLGSSYVHEAGLVVSSWHVPDDNGDGSAATIVGEGEGVGAVGANPDVAIVRDGVGSLSSHANVRHVLAVALVQTGYETAAAEATLLERLALKSVNI